MGKALMFLSRFQEAEAAFAEAVRLDDASRLFAAPQRSFVFYLWGGALTNLRRYAQAEQKLVEALRLDSNNALAQNFLATLRTKLQNNK
jgi:tetratricopeptide (TPR) repeat protein